MPFLYLLVLDTCESVPFLYLLQTCRHKIYARTCFTNWDQVFTQAFCREILDQVLLLTVESVVDFVNGLRWGEPNVSFLWTVTFSYHLKVYICLTFGSILCVWVTKVSLCCVLSVCVVFWMFVLCSECLCCVLNVCVVFWLFVLCSECLCCVLNVCIVFWMFVLCSECLCCVLNVCVVFWMFVLCSECVVFWIFVLCSECLNRPVNLTFKRSSDQYSLIKPSLAGAEAHFVFTDLGIWIEFKSFNQPDASVSQIYCCPLTFWHPNFTFKF